MNRPAPIMRALPESPEQRLRSLFAEEDALLSKLADVRAGQKVARNDYAAAHGLLILPALAKLREVLG